MYNVYYNIILHKVILILITTNVIILLVGTYLYIGFLHGLKSLLSFNEKE